MNSKFLKGLYDGIPIGLGYLSVAFGFGIMAMRAGISTLAAVGISASNLTSAGQAAGVGVIAAGGSLIEMALTQLVINLRYSLMGISLSQKVDGSFGTIKRMIAAYGITDEIFAVAISKEEKLTARYMYGLILVPFIGWSLGTFLGAVFGQLLPENVSSALGIMLYAMFIAVVVPKARDEHKVILAVSIAAGISILFKYVLTFVSSGFAVIISAVIASAVCALVFPVNDSEDETEATA